MHALVKDGAVLRRQDFGDELPPELLPAKGMAWLPIDDSKAGVALDPTRQVAETTERVVRGKLVIETTLRDMTAGERAIARERRVGVILTQHPISQAMLHEFVLALANGEDVKETEALKAAQAASAKIAALGS